MTPASQPVAGPFSGQLVLGTGRASLRGPWHVATGAAGRIVIAAESGVTTTAAVIEWAADHHCRGESRAGFERFYGSMVIIDLDQRRAVLACHPSGLHPIFYSLADGVLEVANSLSRLGGSRHAPDPAGVLEHLYWGWCVGTRTPLHGVSRIEPGAVVACSAETPGLSRLACSAWPATPAAGDRPEGAWRAFVDAIPPSPGTEPVAVMMSAGWDSRMVLAGVLQRVPAHRILLYSHGPADSRELQLVRRIGETLGCNTHIEPLRAHHYDLTALIDGFQRTGNIQFPYWHHAAWRLRSMGVHGVHSGVLGEILGGHYGSARAGSPTQTLMAALLPRWAERGDHRDPLSEATGRLTGLIPKGKPWFLSSAAWDAFRSSGDEIEGDIHAWLTRELQVVDRSLPSLLEHFFANHRGGQYIGEQPRSFLGVIDCMNPFGEVRSLYGAAGTPFAVRSHNRMSRTLLRRHLPVVLRHPTAACLVPAAWPIPLQEGSRALRKLLEHAAPGYAAGLSWADFEFLRGAPQLEALAATFRSGLIDQDAVLSRIRAAAGSRGGNMHSLADMLLKICNLEWWLGPPASLPDLPLVRMGQVDP